MSGGAYDGPVYNNPQYQFVATAAFVKQRALADQGCDAYSAGLIRGPVRFPGWNQSFYGGRPGPYDGGCCGGGAQFNAGEEEGSGEGETRGGDRDGTAEDIG